MDDKGDAKEDTSNNKTEEQPKLRSWARNRQQQQTNSNNNVAGDSAASTTTGERSWVTRRKQGMNSLEDLASKYHKMKRDQDEKLTNKPGKVPCFFLFLSCSAVFSRLLRISCSFSVSVF